MKRTLIAAALGIGLVALNPPFDHPVFAQASRAYVIQITNLTTAQWFTPTFATTHLETAEIFRAGTRASQALEALAENGDVGPLTSLTNGQPQLFFDAQSVQPAGLLRPGATASLEVRASGAFKFVSVATMLIPTNDTFVGVKTEMPPAGVLKSVYAYAYDAGTEQNDESCASIPGPGYPECGGPGGGGDPGNGEGTVLISNGIVGQGDFGRNRDWKNPVALVTIRVK